MISLPDVSGTVITTGNIEALCDLPYTPLYRLQSRHVLLTAFQIAAFGAQSSQLLQRQSEPKRRPALKNSLVTLDMHLLMQVWAKSEQRTFFLSSMVLNQP